MSPARNNNFAVLPPKLEDSIFVADVDAANNAFSSSPLIPIKLSKFIIPPSRIDSKRNSCLWVAKFRMFAVVLSIGAGSMFLVSLDSVVDNLIPIARNFFINVYGNENEADLAWSWVVSARVYGVAFGCFCAFLLSNWHSRKWPLIASFSINFTGGCLSTFIRLQNVGIYLAFIGRFLSGIGSGLAHVIGAAMLAEIPPICLRGTVLASLTVWACLGELFGMFLSLDWVLGGQNTWHLALGFPVLIIPITLLFLIGAPDSPRALLICGRENEALHSLQFYQKSEDWINSLKDIKMELAHPNSQQTKENIGFCEDENYNSNRQQIISNIKSRFASGKFIRPLFLGAFILTFVHLDDWLWISYSTQAFENAALPPSDAQMASLWMSFPQALISLALLFFFDEFSRRQLLILPTIGSIFCALLVMFAIFTEKINPKSLPILAALDLCMAAIASESAYSVVPELFPQKDRVMGTALVGITQNIFGGFLTTIALPLMNSRGIHFVLIPFVLMNLFYIFFVAKLLPETCGKTFHEISEQFSERLPSFFNFPVQFLSAYPFLIMNKLKKRIIQILANFHH